MTDSTAITVDTEIARLVGEQVQVISLIDAAHTAIEREAKATAEGWSYALVTERADAARVALPGLKAQLVEANDAVTAAEARYTGWNRYYLVNNANGHLHSSLNCTTCYFDTEYKWITSFSGVEVADAIEAAGERCCTVCFPDAPVEKRADRAFRSDAEVAKEVRDAERAAKREAKLAKAIRADGEPVRIVATVSRFSENLATIVAAQNFYADRLAEAERVRAYANDGGRNDDLIVDYTQQAEQALVALADRAGVDVEAKRAELADKVAKKIKRELV